MHKLEWVAYLMGALLALAFKFAKFYYESRKAGTPANQVILIWIFEDSKSNISSWVATFGVVWTCGYLFIDRVVDWSLLSYLNSIPLHFSTAFLFGVIMEYTAPALFKLVVSKLPWQAGQ